MLATGNHMSSMPDERSVLDVLVFVPAAFYAALFAVEIVGAPATTATLAYAVPAIAFLLFALAHRSLANRVRTLQQALRERRDA